MTLAAYFSSWEKTALAINFIPSLASHWWISCYFEGFTPPYKIFLRPQKLWYMSSVFFGRYYGNKVDHSWISHRSNMDITWIQHGFNMDPACIQHGSLCIIYETKINFTHFKYESCLYYTKILCASNMYYVSIMDPKWIQVLKNHESNRDQIWIQYAST